MKTALDVFGFPRALAALCLLALSLCIPGLALDRTTPLDRYVNAPDSHYHYEFVKSYHGKGYTAYVLDLTSQQWRSEKDVDHSIWKHWLTIIRPDTVSTETGMLFINGGSITNPMPAGAPPEFVTVALATHSVTAELRGIPNEPLHFTGEEKPRNEDSIIAHTWVKYLKSGDDTWPLQFPMTKAAVRALDAVSEFSASEAGGKVKVSRFLVAGGSKRGWTAWLTAAVDSRVVGVVPMVIDLLNQQKSFDHHYQVYGFYSEAIRNYVEEGVMSVRQTKESEALLKMVDPFSFRDRYTMPKLLINASGDQYFLPDSSQFYFDQLPGEKYLRYVPNAAHALNADARVSLIAFYDMLLHDQPRPKFTWAFEKNGDIRVDAETVPTAVKLWVANNPEKRDFRFDVIGAAYQSTSLQPETGGKTWIAHIEKPTKGWTAYFVELTFANGPYPLKLTTAVRVTPDTLPFQVPKATGRISDLR